MKNHIRSLLSATAFANVGYRMTNETNSPDPRRLVALAEMAGEQGGANPTAWETTIKSEDMTKRAPDMASMVEYWDLTDDLILGRKALVDAGEKYLPKFPDEEAKDYSLRLSLTKMTNVYRDIVESLVAKPFEEEITFVESEKDAKVPAEIESFSENVDGLGNNITVFSSQLMFHGVNSAIDWLLIDSPVIETGTVISRDKQKRERIFPFWSRVLGRNVYEARETIIGSERVLSYIRIFEPGNGEPNRFRIYRRSEAGGVEWALYVETADDKQAKHYVLENSGRLNISRIPAVPYITGRRDGASFQILPALNDAADLQIKLYQNESALEYISNLAGYPMLAANGMRPEMEADGKTPKKLRVGPGRTLWGMPDGKGNHGNWAYVEPSSQSMAFLEGKIKNTKQDLRELGKQPLTADSGNLTVITTAYAAGKSRSAVSAWALALKDTLENALVISCEFMGVKNYDPEVNVYTEFDNFADGNSDLEALNQARKRGDISQETYLFELRRRKVLSPEFDIETERERLLKEVPGEPDLEDDDDLSPPVP